MPLARVRYIPYGCDSVAYKCMNTFSPILGVGQNDLTITPEACWRPMDCKCNTEG